MAIIHIEKLANEHGLEQDRRFRSWARVIRNKEDLDLSREGGNAILSDFVNFNKTIAVEPGQFLLIAAETGSVKYHSYSYRFFKVAEDNTVQKISKPERLAFFESRKDEISEEFLAKAENSIPFAWALYSYLHFTSEKPISPLTKFTDDELIEELKKRNYIVERRD